MPVHKVGYRGWNEKKTPQWNRWWIITETGCRIAFKSAWVRRILLLCWLPVLYWGVAFFFVEQAMKEMKFDNPSTEASEDSSDDSIGDLADRQINSRVFEQFADRMQDEFDMLPQTDSLMESLRSGNKQEFRHTIWSWLLMTFFRYPQGTAILFLLGFIAPGLISRDVRSRAFLLYFSRPIGRIEYLLGKFFVPIAFLILVTTLPALCLFLFAVVLSPDLSVVLGTWDVPFRILGASICLIIPTCSIALMLSSITQESRFATFAWFAIWALGHAAWLAIVITQAVRLDAAPFDAKVMQDKVVQDWSVVSLYNNLSAVQSWIFGFEPFQNVIVSLAALVAISVVSLFVLYRGISAPMNI